VLEQPVRRGIVAFDVDGVLLRGLFLWRLAWRSGPWVLLRSLWLGFLLKTGAIRVETAVEKAYRLQRGRSIEELCRLADSIALRKGAAECCVRLKELGYEVVLVSAGVPEQVIERIATRCGADEGRGVPLEIVDGKLTGRLVGEWHSGEGKRRALERFLEERGFDWSDTTVVVDDRSNTEIVEAAWRSIAINPEYPVLPLASFVIHTRDLREILEFLPEGRRFGYSPAETAARHEVFRKALHSCAIIAPFLALWWRGFALWLVGSVTLLLVLSEVFRQLGVALPFFADVTWRAMRPEEERGIVGGPILYGVGIWLALRLFPLDAASIGIFVLALGDSLASLAGKAFGQTQLPHNPRKTVVGSLTVFAVGAVIAMMYVPLPSALFVGLVASLVESLPIGALDNLLLPVATAAAVVVSSGLWA
jgi:HAD superfamily phosphoserine phosphatase-like hydrolase